MLPIVSHQTVVASVYPHRTYSLENLPKQPFLDWPECFLSRISRNRSYHWLTIKHYVTKQFEIQDVDFHFSLNANKPLRLPVSLTYLGTAWVFK